MEGRTYRCQLKLTKFWITFSMQIIFLLQTINANDCEPPTKIECGRQGFKYYTAQKCVEDKRCCWNENNVPNCYYKATPQCQIDPINRVDCGNKSTTPTECLSRSCCWNATLVGKWCYHPINTATAQLPDPHCQIDPINRVDCGNKSTTQTECLSRSCCWNATVVGKWCYHPINTGRVYSNN